MQMASSLAFEHVEIASILGNCEHITPAQMTEDYAAQVRELLDKHCLNAYSFSGHVDLTEEEQLRDFMIKMKFAKQIGCCIINTNCGPSNRMREFMCSIRRIITLAERLDIIVGLESHGDIIDTAKDAALLLHEINHPLIRLNYDTGNTFYYAKGKIDIAEDIKYGFEYLAHIHLKDIRIRGASVQYCPIGQGDIDFPNFFNSLSSIGRPIPCGLEIPIFVCGTLETLSADRYPLSDHTIRDAIDQSIDYIKKR